jgi:hypothetical protein
MVRGAYVANFCREEGTMCFYEVAVVEGYRQTGSLV